EVVIIGDDRRLHRTGEAHQLRINVVHSLAVVLEHFERYPLLLLESIEHVQPSATAAAPDRVCRVRDAPKLLQHEPWNNQGTGDEAGVSDVPDSSVDDCAGIDKHLL